MRVRALVALKFGGQKGNDDEIDEKEEEEEAVEDDFVAFFLFGGSTSLSSSSWISRFILIEKGNEEKEGPEEKLFLMTTFVLNDLFWRSSFGIEIRSDVVNVTNVKRRKTFAENSPFMHESSLPKSFSSSYIFC